MPKIYGLCALLALCVGKVASHSWINNPPQRFPASADYCLLNDDGTVFKDSNGHTVCGEDAKAIDLLVMRPNSFQQNPCYFSGATTFMNVPTRVVETDSTMCVQWAANSHDTDPMRNADGGIRISLSTNLAQPTQADFDKMILANNIPYEKFPGAKVKIPALTPGDYVLQFYWSWPFGTSGKRLFVSCSNLTIVAKGNPRIAAENSQVLTGLGLPIGYNTPPAQWWCNSGDAVFANSSFPTGAPTIPATPAPTVAASATAPTAPGSASINSVPTAASNKASTVAPAVAATPAPTKAPTAAPTAAPTPAPCNCAVYEESDDVVPTLAPPTAKPRATVAPTTPAASASSKVKTSRHESKARNEPKPQPKPQASPQKVVDFEYSFNNFNAGVSASQISVLSGVLCVVGAIVALL